MNIIKTTTSTKYDQARVEVDIDRSPSPHYDDLLSTVNTKRRISLHNGSLYTSHFNHARHWCRTNLKERQVLPHKQPGRIVVDSLEDPRHANMFHSLRVGYDTTYSHFIITYKELATFLHKDQY